MQYFPCHGRMDRFMLDLDIAITPAKSVGVVTHLEMKSQWLSMPARPRNSTRRINVFN
jgi:hypothetical protein